MTSIFHTEARPEPNITPPIAGFLAAGIGAFLFVSVNVIVISKSASSTAVIGYVFLPFTTVIAAILCFFIGWCLGYGLMWWRSAVPRRKISAFVAAMVPLTVGLWIVNTMATGADTTQQVHKIERMDDAQLNRVLDQPNLARNKFILGAIAMNPKAESFTLHRIATIELPELYKGMGSPFNVMGKNTHGIAVMRLVARHQNTAAEDLEKLAQSKNEYVLGDVAANSKVSQATLRKLADHGGQLIEMGLAHNRAAPPDILAKLALSSFEYTRVAVAGNPATLPDLLRELSMDQASGVRGYVALNPSTPPEVREKLLEDPNEQVRRHAKIRQAR